MAAFRFFRFFALLGLLCLLVFWAVPLGCSGEKTATAPSDIDKARNALAQHDIGDAEMYFERYLRKNPKGEERWQVWQELVSIAQDMHNDSITAGDYLEIMLMEFEMEPEKKRGIQLRLARLCESTRKYERAFSLWQELAEDPGLEDEIKAHVYRDLAHAYLRRLEFTPATDTLAMCLDLNVSGATKADCLYALGEAQLFTEDLLAAEDSLRQALKIEEMTDERRVLTLFMLGDVLEQQGKLAEALSCFEEIRDTYPNEKVIGMRIMQIRKSVK